MATGRKTSSKGTSPWRAARDPLHRGDARSGLATTDPAADPSIVRHVLYLDGAGRRTPYHSTSEDRTVAERFAGASGRVYSGHVTSATAEGVTHLSRLELLGLLTGKGKGNGRWSSAYEVMLARKYVEEWSEHLLSYAGLPGTAEAARAAARILR